jgi:hypothetical protein
MPSNVSALALPSRRDALIVEAVRLIEETGPLDDDAALRTAFGTTPTLPGRIAERARTLGRRLGLDDELQRARHWAPWIGAALVVFIVSAGLALAGGVTGTGDRRINVIAALLSLLGVHLLTLIAWLGGLALPWRVSAGPRASLGWLWMALTARVAGGRHGQATVLTRAAARLLTRARLAPWATGIASHGLWTLSFVVVLGAMLFALAFHRYTLDWETTILDPWFFLHAVELLGRVPSWLGFPVPDAAAVLAPRDGAVAVDAAAQRSWALWLVGCIVVYGLLPRAALLALSLAMWRSRRKALAPDLSDPYYQRLAARFQALAPPDIIDADPGVPPSEVRTGRVSAEPRAVGGAIVVAAFELAADQPWPPAGLPQGTRVLPNADGSARSRRELLDAVAGLRPSMLVLAVRAASSPDRGAARLLRELLAHGGACRLWLMPDATDAIDSSDRADRRARWRRWLSDSGLDAVMTSDALADALPASTQREAIA